MDVCQKTQCQSPMGQCAVYDRVLGRYLSRGAVELLQAVFQPLHLGGEVFTPLAQQSAIQLDLLQERLGRGVIVASLVGQVLL